MKKKAIGWIVLAVAIIALLFGWMLWEEKKSVPSYIPNEFQLGIESGIYRLNQFDENSFSLEVTNTKGTKGEFIVKPTQDFSKYIDRPIFVDGQYIFEDGKVMVLIKEIKSV